MELALDRLLLDENSDAIIATTPSATVVYWNRGAEATCGYAGDKAIGRRPPALIANVPDVREIEGTGLGLHLSHLPAGRLGLRITFETRYGGSSFTAHLRDA